MNADTTENTSGEEANLQNSPEKGERVAKFLAHAGICSRRDAERMIEDRRVQVNGKTLDSAAFLVVSSDDVRVDGKRINAVVTKPRLFLYHKPVGLMTTHHDDRGRPTVFESLPKSMPRVVSVGRLDLNSEGLLLLTTDGSLARYMELPSTGWTRRYRVRVFGRIDADKLSSLKKGITIEGVHYKSIEAELEKSSEKSSEKTRDEKPGNVWVRMTLREGKNREIRKVMAALGYAVNRLIRVGYGPFELGTLEKGIVREIPESVYRHQLSGYLKNNQADPAEDKSQTQTQKKSWAKSKKTKRKRL